jgi:hypothetical protein
VPGGDAAEVLQAAERVLYPVAPLIERALEAAFPALIDLGGYGGDRALMLDQVADGVAVIGFVSQHDGARRGIIEQHIGRAALSDQTRIAATIPEAKVTPPGASLASVRISLARFKTVFATPDRHDLKLLRNCAASRRQRARLSRRLSSRRLSGSDMPSCASQTQPSGT